MQKIIPVTEFRKEVLKAVRLVSDLGQKLIITYKGRPAAVLLNYNDWENTLETLEIKSDKKLLKKIQESLAYFKSGKKGVSHTEIDWN